MYGKKGWKAVISRSNELFGEGTISGRQCREWFMIRHFKLWLKKWQKNKIYDDLDDLVADVKCGFPLRIVTFSLAESTTKQMGSSY